MVFTMERPDRYALLRGFGAGVDLADQQAPAREQGQWWVFDIKRKDLKLLMKRQDAKALANYLLWLALLVSSGAVAFATLGTWWAVPAFLVYGTIYSSCDPRSHDLGHGATFRSRWL